MVTNMTTQFATAAQQFDNVGQIPAQLVAGGMKSYQMDGVIDGWAQSLQDGVMANGERFTANGLIMGGFMTSGFIRSWQSEALKTQLQDVGRMVSDYIQQGMLEKVDGGALAQALSDKVITDLATELEK